MLKRKITETELYEKIDTYSMFNFYFGKFELNKKYRSAFRRDEEPSTGFFVGKSGRLVYRDIATGEVYEPVQFVMKAYSMSYHEAIEKIAKDFGLVKGKDNSLRAKLVSNAEKLTEKLKKNFSIDAVSFKEHHLEYWKQFGISEKELIENKVIAVDNIYIDSILNDKIIDRKVITGKADELQFAYVVSYKGRISLRLYAPLADKKYKWMGDLGQKDLFGFDELPFKSDTLIITKGQKDRIIWKKFCTDVVATQNESHQALSKEDAEFLKANTKEYLLTLTVMKLVEKRHNTTKILMGLKQ